MRQRSSRGAPRRDDRVTPLTESSREGAHERPRALMSHGASGRRPLRGAAPQAEVIAHGDVQAALLRLELELELVRAGVLSIEDLDHGRKAAPPRGDGVDDPTPR